MIGKTIATTIKIGVVAFLLLLFFFGGSVWLSTNSFGPILREIASTFRDPSTQWMTVICLICYFALFLFLERHLKKSSSGNESAPILPQNQRKDGADARRLLLNGGFFHYLKNRNIWLIAFVLLALLRYAFGYASAAHSTQFLTLAIGIVFGRAVSVSFRNGNLLQILIFILLALFAAITFAKPEMSFRFQYHGFSRWSGILNNPNLYGLLMGTGVILAAGLIAEMRRWKMESGRWKKILCSVLCSLAVIICGIGLFKSYSRGAWLGTFFALAYLTIKGFGLQISGFKESRKILWSLAIIFIAAGILAFWQFRFSQWRPVQRAVSVANIDDFSWRNRVTAWEGAIRMMADKPLFGFGWGKAEQAYSKNYCPLDESAAIEMNDYFMLGISAGVPALVCFVVYIGLCFKRKKETGWKHCPTLTCRVGAIVLLVGFWFDGGLFKLSVGPIFWMLLELPRLEFVGDEVTSLKPEIGNRKSEIGNQSETPHVVSYTKLSVWLRRAAWILGTVALLQTVLYLSVPFFPVSESTLAFARQCLIPSKEIADFDFLSTNADWRGKKLRVLLQHANLANYNRRLVNWTLDDRIYRKYVLTPTIQPERDGQMNWRRTLWEYFYPRIRHESDSASAAQIVLQQLHEQLTISNASVPEKKIPRSIEGIWRRKKCDAKGFEVISVAALRSVGIASRLDEQGRAEFFDGTGWRQLPQ